MNCYYLKKLVIIFKLIYLSSITTTMIVQIILKKLINVMIKSTDHLLYSECKMFIKIKCLLLYTYSFFFFCTRPYVFSNFSSCNFSSLLIRYFRDIHGVLFVSDLSSVVHHNEIRHFAQAGQLDPREVNRRRALQTVAIFRHKWRGMRSKIRRPAYVLQG